MIRRRGLSAYQLKTSAVIAMLVDHIAWAFVPTGSIPGQLMHAAGRLAAPILCYFVAEGACRTRNKRAYLLRMAVFAAISAPAFCFFEGGGHWVGLQSLGMIYTLTLGLMAVWADAQPERPVWSKAACIAGFCLLSLAGDWPVAGVLWPVIFARYRGRPRRQFLAFWAVAWCVAAWFMARTAMRTPSLWWVQSFQFATVLAVPLLACYDGTLSHRGRTRAGKWFFYIFYPAHLVVLGLAQRFF
ncbi:MAG: TraX family protein [Gemmiger sp.]